MNTRTMRSWCAWTRPASNWFRRPVRPSRRGSGQPRACDYEYQRNGVNNLVMLFAPLEGLRRVEATDRRTRTDWAEAVRKLLDEDYADKERIVLVMDNLNTHHPASLSEAFEPAEAMRLAERLEIHYTSKHGSWLNIAEIELGVLARQWPGPADPQPGRLGARNRSMAGATQPGGNSSGLALHHRGRPHQAQVPLPVNTIASDY